MNYEAHPKSWGFGILALQSWKLLGLDEKLCASPGKMQARDLAGL